MNKKFKAFLFVTMCVVLMIGCANQKASVVSDTVTQPATIATDATETHEIINEE